MFLLGSSIETVTPPPGSCPHSLALLGKKAKANACWSWDGGNERNLQEYATITPHLGFPKNSAFLGGNVKNERWVNFLHGAFSKKNIGHSYLVTPPPCQKVSEVCEFKTCHLPARLATGTGKAAKVRRWARSTGRGEEAAAQMAPPKTRGGDGSAALRWKEPVVPHAHILILDSPTVIETWI